MTRSIILAQCACAFALGMVSATPAKADLTASGANTIALFDLIGYDAGDRNAYIVDYNLTREDCESQLVSHNLWKIVAVLRFNVVRYSCELSSD
jgi:hypothetical protein